MKTKYFISILVAAFAFALFAPESVTRKVRIGGKVLYGSDRIVLKEKSSAVKVELTQQPESLIDECELPEKPKTITGPRSMCSGIAYTFTAALVEGAVNYEWELPEGWEGSSRVNVITVRAGEAGGDILVRAVNDCGVSETKHFTAMLNSSPVLPVITTDGTDLISSASEGNQWYYESNAIKDAIDDHYTPKEQGKYHVCVTNRNSCSSCSLIMESSELTVISKTSDEDVDDGMIFPNPSTGLFTIKSTKCDDFIIYDSQGELVWSQRMDQEEVIVDLTWKPKGPYWVELHYGTSTITRKILIN